MGYRLYLGEIEKKEHDKIQKMSYSYLSKKYGKESCGDDDEYYVGCYDFAKELYSFGKYYEVDTDKYNHFFADKELQKRFSDHDFWVVDKDFLLGIIEKERAFLEEWYTKSAEKNSEEELRASQKSMALEWSLQCGAPYNLHLEDINLVDSWKREYAIFDLIRILKTFDFEKKHLVYYGW